jgi:vacuolar-type H+-ATPase subunit E/Vma4
VTAVLPGAPPDPLAPVREALVASARADAERLLVQADAEAEVILARARAEADAIRADSRAEGEADAASALVTERARSRRQARAVLLAAQAQSYARLRASAVEESATLRGDPAYGPWREDMSERIRARLGEDAVVTELPEGGVRGEAPGRRVEYTLGGLAEQAVEALGSDVEGLWAP